MMFSRATIITIFKALVPIYTMTVCVGIGYIAVMVNIVRNTAGNLWLYPAIAGVMTLVNIWLLIEIQKKIDYHEARKAEQDAEWGRICSEVSQYAKTREIRSDK